MTTLREEIKDIVNNIMGFDGNGIYDNDKATNEIISKIEKRINSKDNIESFYNGEFGKGYKIARDEIKEMLK